LATEKPNLREASCCNVEVVNGADGVFLPGLTSIFENLEFFISFRNCSACLISVGSFESSALNCFPPCGIPSLHSYIFSSHTKSQITLKNDSD
jgi:hypothetical protein